MADSLPFYVRGDDGREYGPVELDELREWVHENRAGLGTTVRSDLPGARWQSWQSYPELVALLAEVQAGGRGQAYTVAPMGPRILAFVLDFILSCILVAPILAVVETIYMPDWNAELVKFWANPAMMSDTFARYIFIGNLIAYIGLIFYMAGFHAAHGQTPAKAILRLHVIDPSGQKPAFGKALLRALVYAVSLKLFCLPLFSALLNPQRRALHDWVTGTMVVRS